jgi:hypothetical protein
MASGLPKDSVLGQQAKELKMRKLHEAIEQYCEELWDKTTAPDE